METATAPDTTLQPRIYVVCRAAYDSGTLHGAWIDVTGDEWALWDAIQAMLAQSPIPDAEDYAIYDHEEFQGARLWRSMGLTEVARLAASIADNGPLGSLLLDHCGGDLAEAQAALAHDDLVCMVR